MNLIELKDHRVCIRNTEGVLAESPGFANIVGKEPVFGDAARAIARLHPRQSFNQFWHNLSLDPLLIKTKLFRHNADIGYSHLQSLMRGLSLQQETALAVPATYTRNHLGILLGLMRQSAVNVAALIDHALLQAASTNAEDCIIIDLQLHQAALISFRRIEGMLVKERVIHVPNAGLLALYDAYGSAVADEFLQQSRFNPMHSAETEQYISDQLDRWLQASNAQGELLLEINHKGTVHQARLTHERFAQASKNLLTRIARDLPELGVPASSLHIHSSHLALPGLAAAFPGIRGVADDAAMQVWLEHRDILVKPGEALAFVTRLPLDGGNVSTTASVPAARQPTHVLYQHEAIALPQGRLAIGTPPPSVQCARVLALPALQLPGAVVLQRTARGVIAEVHGPVNLRCNDLPLAPGQLLRLGDSLQLDNSGSLQLIAVE